MRDGRCGYEANSIASVDSVGLRCCAWAKLVTPDSGRGYVGYGALKDVRFCVGRKDVDGPLDW